MKTKLGLAVLLIAALGLTGCATSSKTDAPEGASAAKSGASQGSGSGASTGAASGQGSAKGESMSKDGQLPFELTVHFAFDSTSLDEQSRKVVEAHGRYLAANPNVKVRLEGHTDVRGSREYNLALGERRAQTVEKLLRVLNIPANRVSVTSYGEEKPAMPGNNEEAWAFNRRVEFVY